MKNSAKQSIHKFYQQWFAAMENENIDGFLSLLADDFYIKTPGQPPISDINELRKGLEQYHQRFKSTVDWQIEEVQLFADHAIVRVVEKVMLINRQTKDTSKYQGIHLALLKKQTNNEWQLKTDVSSMNNPPPDNPQQDN